MNEVIIYLPVLNILPPFKSHDKTFYPVSINGLRGKKGSYIFNALVEIPKDTKLVQGTLYTYKGEFKIKDIKPYK